MILWFYLEDIYVNNSPIFTDLVALGSRQKSKLVKFETGLNIEGRPGSRFQHPGDSMVLEGGCDPGPNPGSTSYWLHTIKDKRICKMLF